MASALDRAEAPLLRAAARGPEPCCALREAAERMYSRFYSEVPVSGTLAEDARPLHRYLRYCEEPYRRWLRTVEPLMALEPPLPGCVDCRKEMRGCLDRVVAYLVDHAGLSETDPGDALQLRERGSRPPDPAWGLDPPHRAWLWDGPQHSVTTQYALEELVGLFEHLEVPALWLGRAIQIAARTNSNVRLMEVLVRRAKRRRHFGGFADRLVPVVISSLQHVVPGRRPGTGSEDDDDGAAGDDGSASDDDDSDGFVPTEGELAAFGLKCERMLGLLLGLPGVRSAAVAVLDSDAAAMAQALGFSKHGYGRELAAVVADRLRERLPRYRAD